MSSALLILLILYQLNAYIYLLMLVDINQREGYLMRKKRKYGIPFLMTSACYQYNQS